MSQSNNSSVIKYAKPSRRAFVFFSHEHKATIRNATGLGKGREGRKALDAKVAESWKFLAQEHREKYVEMERQDKMRFRREVADGLPVKKSGFKKVQTKSKVGKGAPKKPLSSFMLFSNANRKRLVDNAEAAGEDCNVGAVSKRLGKEWRKMTEEQRQPYVDQYSKATEEYVQAVGEYLGRDVESPKKAKKSEKDPNKPKRFVSAYIKFASANRERVKASFERPPRTTEMSRALAAEWKALSAEQKLPFQQEAAADSARFSEEMQAYRLRNGLQQSAKGSAGSSKAKNVGAAKAATTVKKHGKRDA